MKVPRLQGRHARAFLRLEQKNGDSEVFCTIRQKEIGPGDGRPIHVERTALFPSCGSRLP